MSEETTDAKKTNLDKATRILVEEIRKYGFSTDTIATDRLHQFVEALLGIGDSYHAVRINEIDNSGKGRRDAEIYCLIVIGQKCEKDPTSLFRMDECVR